MYAREKGESLLEKPVALWNNGLERDKCDKLVKIF